MDLQKRLLVFLKNNCLINEEDSLLLGVSGGIDSMVLTHLLLESEYTFSIAHCNFNLRGSESDEDELFVKEFAQKHDIPFYTKRFDTSQFSKSQHISIQMAARQLRIDWFTELLKTDHYHSVLLAHHLDDNIETVFLNLIRGAGIDGLKGISPVNGKFVRPLLFATRKEIVEYSVSKNIQFREDSSNRKDDYLRNKIRHNIIPQFAALSTSFYNKMSENIEHFRNTSLLLDELVEEIRKKITVQKSENVCYKLVLLKRYRNTGELLYQILSRFNFGSTDTGNILKNIDNSETTEYFSESHYAQLKSGIIEIREIIQESTNNEYVIHDITSLTTSTLPVRFGYEVLNKTPELITKTEPHIAMLDYDMLQFPLTLRRWKTGDRFIPFGMRQSKLLSDLFTDLKLTKSEKSKIWVLCTPDDIVWVVGRRIHNAYRVGKKTKCVVKLSVFK